jgi:hypothetical protein
MQEPSRIEEASRVDDAQRPQDSPRMDDRHRDHIARRAYELYLSRGGGHGSDWEDWLAAERELTAGRGDESSRGGSGTSGGEGGSGTSGGEE